MLRPAPDFQNIMARAGLRAIDIIRSAEISKSTYYGWLNPATQPHRRGGIGLVNAYKIAKVYAAAAQVDEEDAFQRIFVDVAEQVEA